MRVAIIAAEPSGDQLGAGLMRALRERLPDLCFEGVGGAQMQAVGMQSLAPMETLSVMGLVEVLAHLPGLLRLRRSLLARWRVDPPDLFIGIDAPDFNFLIERRLRAAGVPTVHYVSPTVWAWREGRVQTLREATDLLLSILPFEPEFLERRGVHAVYVGHRLAAEMPLEPDRQGARQALGFGLEEPVLAVLPGSRKGELERLARPFLQSARACAEQLPGLRVVTPLVNEDLRLLWRTERARYAPDLEVVEVMQDSRRALAAADVALTASGTATFEALLSKRPMVVGYKLNPLTYWLARALRLVKLEHVAMANLLAGEGLAPEFIQGACEPGRLVPALMAFFRDQGRVASIQRRYREIHEAMIVDTDRRAAEAVLDLVAQHGRRAQ
ncbi:MAG: lipid-A-disaccharide synthase [Gammaproteobacteria bacterium]|nr:MAG: lipid-A-disaccharide synthase [Gammaproteobacteria bacterium]